MLRDRYINPLTDFGFKRLFGSEPNKVLLIDFLNVLLPVKHRIEDGFTVDRRIAHILTVAIGQIFDPMFDWQQHIEKINQ